MDFGGDGVYGDKDGDGEDSGEGGAGFGGGFGLVLALIRAERLNGYNDGLGVCDCMELD